MIDNAREDFNVEFFGYFENMFKIYTSTIVALLFSQLVMFIVLLKKFYKLFLKSNHYDDIR